MVQQGMSQGVSCPAPMADLNFTAFDGTWYMDSTNQFMPAGCPELDGSTLLGFLGMQVLDTDYTSFATMFRCMGVPLVSLNLEFAWVLSRTPNISASSTAYLDQISTFETMTSVPNPCFASTSCMIA